MRERGRKDREIKQKDRENDDGNDAVAATATDVASHAATSNSAVAAIVTCD